MKRKVEVGQGMTMAILDCIRQAKEPLAVSEMVEVITKSGRNTNSQEVSSLLVTIQKSQVKEMLEIKREGRSNSYSLKEVFKQASLDQLQMVYLKRLRYSHQDLLRDLGVEDYPVLAMERGDLPEDPVVEVKGKKITLVLHDRDTEISIKYI
jgi:hypothetical protein